MGTFYSFEIQTIETRHIMKLLHLSFFAASIFAENIFEDADEANSVLRAKRFSLFGTTDANGATHVGTTTTQSYEDIQKQKVENFIEDYHLTSVEAWGELKEVMEAKSRAKVPEEKVYELESCVSSCARKERWLKFGPGDKSIEEQKQNQEEAYEASCDKGRCDKSVFKKLIPCPKCFRYVPAVGGDLIGDGLGQILDSVNP